MGGKRVPLFVFIVLFFCSLGNSTAASSVSCSNGELRAGLSAALPDCRAYELVTPPDSNGRLIEAFNTFGLPPHFQVLPSELASPTRDSVVFMTYQGALSEFRGGTGVADVYEAERGVNGWKTIRRLSPAGSQALAVTPGGISPDHTYNLNTITAAGKFSSFAPNEIYLSDSAGSFEQVGIGSLGVEPYAQARHIGEGGEHIVFSTGDDFTQSAWCFSNSECKVIQLEPDAPPTGTGTVYDRSADGLTHVVSLLPGDITPASGEEAYPKGTSEDGTATAFEIKGVLYVRIDNAETVEVASDVPTFAGLSDDGSYAFYVQAGNIHRFDIGSEEDSQVNSTGDGQIVNVSGDGSHVYFISEAPIGGKGTAGQPNMYVWSGGASEYIATVIPSDLETTSGSIKGVPALTNWTEWVANRPKNNAEQGPGADSFYGTRGRF